MEKKCDLQFEKTYLFYCSFLALHFKDDFVELEKELL
jgi:hypothetical protein